MASTDPVLVGQTITKVRLATPEEMDLNGFERDFRVPLVIELSSGTVLMPSQDDEGNGPGAIFLNHGNLSYYMQAEG